MAGVGVGAGRTGRTTGPGGGGGGGGGGGSGLGTVPFGGLANAVTEDISNCEVAARMLGSDDPEAIPAVATIMAGIITSARISAGKIRNVRNKKRIKDLLIA
jgi:hypothetical protein